MYESRELMYSRASGLRRLRGDDVHALCFKSPGGANHPGHPGLLLVDHRRALSLYGRQGPLIHTAFETGASTASGVKAGLEMRGDTETTVAAWVGDGGTFDIGIQALSGAAERNDDIIYFCYDNEAYMNTGIQRSSATPWGTWTTTTPSNHPKGQPKKNMMEIMAAHRIPYAATCSVAFPEDMMRKITKPSRSGGRNSSIFFPPARPDGRQPLPWP